MMNRSIAQLGRRIIPAIVMLLLTSFYAQAQKARKVNYEREMRVVRNCEYEVLRGLGEIMSITKTKDKSESLLGHDEYVVKFNFTPMEPGHKLMTTLQDQEFELYLRSSNIKVPIGPKYIEHYKVIKGLKFAMEFLQSRDECNDKWLYESRGLPNDLFEAQDKIADYKKAIYEGELEKYEAAHEMKKQGLDPETFNSVPNPKDPKANTPETNPEVDPKGTDPIIDPKVNPVIDTKVDTTVDEPKVDLNDAELRKQLEAEARKKAGLDNSGTNPDSIRALLEKEAREKIDKEKQANANDVIKDAKKNAKEEARRQKELEEQAKLDEADRLKNLEAKKAELQKDIEAKIADEVAAKKNKENALRDQIEKEIRRESCAYKDKLSGTIEIISVEKSTEEAESVFGYAEYEVKYKFRPDNYSEIDKKERKIWDETYIFKLDPQGKSANPSATYIRKNQVFKGQKHKGFAQVLESGICDQIMIYAPEMPISSDQVKK
jgi:hypothetical protein